MTVTNPCGDPNMTAAHTVELFSKVPEALRFDPGAVIFSQGEAGTVMYGILEGQINLVVQGQVVETIAAGDVLAKGLWSITTAPVHRPRSRRPLASWRFWMKSGLNS
jgi:hypothetical protein